MKSLLAKPIVVSTLTVMLCCSGFYVYMQWDTDRFISELGVPDTFESVPEPSSLRAILTNDQPNTQGGGVEPFEILETPIDPASIKANNPTLDDATIEIPSLGEGFVDGIEYSGSSIGDFIAAVEASSGTTSDTDVVTDVLEKMSNGTATSDDILRMTSAWLRILPEDDHVNRASLTTFLKDQYELRRHTESEFTQVLGVEYTIEINPEE